MKADGREATAARSSNALARFRAATYPAQTENDRRCPGGLFLRVTPVSYARPLILRRRACATASCACCWRCSATAAVAEEESRQHHRRRNPGRSQLYYYNYLADIAPLAIRTFTNAREWQRRMFGWMPSERTTVLLQDFADYGNAHAFAAPRGTLIVDVAPLLPRVRDQPGRRAHVLDDEPRAGPRRAERHRVGGGPALAPVLPRQGSRAIAQSRDAALQLPHHSALHRAALVFGRRRRIPRDVHGRRPRPRAGRLRRDGVSRDGARRRALLRPAGARVARHAWSTSRPAPTPTSTARASSPGSPTRTGPTRSSRGCERDEGSARYYADQFQRYSACRWSRPGRSGSRSSTSSSGAISPRCASSRSRRSASSCASALGSVSRMYYDEATGILYGAFRYPGVVEHVGALNTRDGSVRRLADIKGALHYMVASFAYDPQSGTAFYTNDNNALRDLMAVDVRHGQGADAAREREHRRARLQPGRPLAHRRAAPLRPRHRWCASRIRTRIGRSSTRFRGRTCPRTSTSRRDGTLLSATMTDDRGNQYVRVWKLASAARTATSSRCRSSRSDKRFPKASCSRATDAISTAAATTPACRTSTATKSPPARSRRCRTPRPDSSGRCRSPTAGWSCSSTPARASSPPSSIRSRSRT